LKNLKLLYDENVDFLVKELGYTSRPDLYYAISVEKINITEILKSFKTKDGRLIAEKRSTTGEQAPKQDTDKRKSNKDPQTKIYVNGELADQYEYQLAKCCNPVPGDDIFAFVSATHGMKIHRTTCPNATHIMANYGYRVMKAEWSDEMSSNFVVDLQITGIDDGPGVIQRLTQEISSTLNINIRSFSIAGDEGYFEGHLSLMVLNKDQLNHAINKISKIDGVSTVVRYEKVK
jgi:GTP pyrophosphokinase